MPTLAVIGAQWGDEGKGKLVDYLTSGADLTVRFQGGNNAGHTLVVGGVKTKLSLVPSGILHAHPRCLLGAGVVADPGVFLTEIETLARSGVDVSPRRIMLDRDAHLILDYHCAIDKAREEMLGKAKIGTTGRGIGPAYEDRAQRSGVRAAELTALPALKIKLEQKVELRNRYLREVLRSETQVDFATLWEKVRHYADKLVPYIGNVSLELQRALDQNKKVVFEGAQGTLLDQTFGTVPFVTSSNTIAGAVTTGCGIGPKHINYVLGVAKAYSTRVGSGPFPTELTDELGELLRKRGDEYGTITRRPRRCGWFDAVAMRRAVRLNGLDSLAITKLDVLSGFDELKICIKYTLDGKELEDVPALIEEYDRLKPEFVTLSGWQEDITKVRKWHQLPNACRLYLSTISDILGCPISIVSVAPDREATLFSQGASFPKNFVAFDEKAAA